MAFQASSKVWLREIKKKKKQETIHGPADH